VVRNERRDEEAKEVRKHQPNKMNLVELVFMSRPTY